MSAEHIGTMESTSPVPATLSAADAANAPALKRKRSPSISSGTPSAAQQPAAKATKTSNQLSINYLVRQSQEDLPLINKDASLPSLLHLLSQYSNILDRHESLASNLGARPLGPILIKRFERCFDSKPKVIASHHKGASVHTDETAHGHITWLEVIEFARSHPAQFTLSTFSEGRRVCQFYYPQKQLRVQISEEDFLFINSGRCQELIPPLPIWEDEEKEVGTCDVLEAKLRELTNVADMVAARTRQLGHRLKGRRSAILERRAEGGSGTPAKASALQTTTAPLGSTGGNTFTSVNGSVNGDAINPAPPAVELGSSVIVRNELLRHFESLPHNQTSGRAQPRHSVAGFPDPHAERPNGSSSYAHHDHTTGHGRAASNTSSLSPVPPSVFANDSNYYTGNDARQLATPSQRPPSSHAYGMSSSNGPLKHNFSRPLPPALESSQPFRPLCQAHMDSLPRGTRVIPPCDRCRRLRMDCVKNLTSCAGCTKKHARCHWRDVSREELGALEQYLDSGLENGTMQGGFGDDSFLEAGAESDDDDSNPLEDLEALGEQEELERRDEEGMRSARELARLGWEEGLKNTQAAGQNLTAATADADADGSPIGGANGVSSAVDGNAANGDATNEDATNDAADMLVEELDDGPGSLTAALLAAEKPDLVAEQNTTALNHAADFVGGGFHAVNDGGAGGWGSKG